MAIFSPRAIRINALHHLVSNSSSLATWLRFILVSLMAFSLTVAIAWFVDLTGEHYLVGLSIIVTLVQIISFFAHRFFTYPQSWTGFLRQVDN